MGVIPPKGLHRQTVDSGVPAGHPGLGNDQQARSLGRHAPYRAIGIRPNAVGRRKRLTWARGHLTQGIEIHEDRQAGINPTESARVEPTHPTERSPRKEPRRRAEVARDWTG